MPVNTAVIIWIALTINSKGKTIKVSVDQDICIDSGNCEATARDIFVVTDGKSHVKVGQVPESQEEAYHCCDPDSFSFETTREVEELSHFIGQGRALEAVDFGIDMQQRDFNLFVIGPEGTGRHSMVESFVHDKASHSASRI